MGRGIRKRRDQRARTSSRLSLGVVLLLAALSVRCAYAQSDSLAPGFSISGILGPSLTDDPQTAPVTTLSVDLLAPQRPYIFDPSGASVTANSSNPDIYSSSFSSSTVQTDTQIRDSSQTGQTSPYAVTAQRLGLTVSGDNSSGNQGNSLTSTGSFHRSLNSEDDNGPLSMATAYQSNWSRGSASGRQPDESSWGSRRLNQEPSGRNQADSLAANHELGAGSNWRVGPTDSLGSRYGRARSNSFGSVSAAGRAGPSGSEKTTIQSMMGASGNGRAAGSRMRNPGAAGAQSGASMAKGGNADSSRNALTFFPQADSGPASLGDSPFSSPGGDGELHFLNPNIYAATSHGSSSPNRGKGSGGEGSLRDRLDSSASHYGLKTSLRADGPEKVTGNKSRLENKSHVRTGIPGPGNL